MISSEEHRHIRHGPSLGERPVGAGLVDVVIESSAPGVVLGRAQEVLVAVLDHGDAVWPPVSTWKSVLPPWFVEVCLEGPEEDDAEAELARWQAMSVEEQSAAEAEARWSLADWLYWFEPGRRQWHWWGAKFESDSRIRVSVQVAGWPAPLGALEWLLRAAGSDGLEIEGVVTT